MHNGFIYVCEYKYLWIEEKLYSECVGTRRGPAKFEFDLCLVGSKMNPKKLMVSF